jgi:hypothetical protein
MSLSYNSSPSFSNKEDDIPQIQDNANLGCSAGIGTWTDDDIETFTRQPSQQCLLSAATCHYSARPMGRCHQRYATRNGPTIQRYKLPAKDRSRVAINSTSIHNKKTCHLRKEESGRELGQPLRSAIPLLQETNSSTSTKHCHLLRQDSVIKEQIKTRRSAAPPFIMLSIHHHVTSNLLWRIPCATIQFLEQSCLKTRLQIWRGYLAK